jgi:hypothetical protein
MSPSARDLLQAAVLAVALCPAEDAVLELLLLDRIALLILSPDLLSSLTAQA